MWGRVMPTVFVLGPSLETVIEPEPVPKAVPGRVGIRFDEPATEPGGKVKIVLEPRQKSDDVLPLNVYAFYVNPPSSVPPAPERTPEWFFASGAPNGSVDTSHGPEKAIIAVPNVLPGAYHVQTVLEYPA
jgi:hypothetical protein